MRMFLMYFGTALKQLARNKGRSILTMLGIIIGIGSVIFIMTTGEIAKNFLLKQISSFGTNVIEVAVTGEMGFLGDNENVELTEDDVKMIKNSSLLSEVEGISAGFSVMKTLERDGANVTISIFGDYPELATVNNLNVRHGRFFTASDQQNGARVIVLGKALAQELFNSPEQAVGQRVKIGGIFFQVIGVVDDFPLMGGMGTPDITYAPLATIKRLFADAREQKKISYMLIKFESGTNVVSFKNRLEYELRQAHDIAEDADNPFMIVSREQFLEIFDSVLLGIQLFISAVAAISLIVGGIGIMNIMLVTVKERTKEIGLRKAVGAKDRSIMIQFLIESMILTTVGGVIGIISSVGLSLVAVVLVQYFQPTWGVQFVLVPQAIIIACAVAMTVGIIFGLYPAVKAAQLHPIESLRYE